jgi:hypothetical protein
LNFDKVCYKIIVFLEIERGINQIEIGECLNGYTLVSGKHWTPVRKGIQLIEN